MQGGAGGSALWSWSQTGGSPAKIGRSRKFNAHQKIVGFHSRAAAALFPGGEECYGVLAHNLSNDPFEDKEGPKKLKLMCLVPSPSKEDATSGDDTDPESEDEDHPWVSPH